MTLTRTSPTVAAFRAARRSRGVALRYVVDEAVIELTAVAGRTATYSESQDGVGLSSRVADWLIEAGDLVLGDERIVPDASHRIEVVNGDGTVTAWEPAPLDGARCYEVMGAGGMAELYRVHANQAATEPA